MSQPKQKKHTTRTPLGRAVLVSYRILVVLALIVVVLYAAYSFFVQPPKVEAPIVTQPIVSANPLPGNPSEVIPTTAPLMRKEDFHTFLLIGTDDGNGNADTILVASYDVAGKKAGVVSVPRDTLVDVKRTVKKINGAYGAGGVEQVKQEVSALLGFSIDHTIQVDIRAFSAIVDAVDGIDFNVPQTMYHNDGAGFVINLQKGQQHLTGHQALELVRFRGYADADIGRIAVQQQFLSAMAKKVLSLSSITKINQFLDIFAEYVKTDLSLGNLAYFAMEAMKLDTASGVTMATLPGDGLVTYKGIPYYYELFPEETLQIINDSLNPYTTPITEGMAHIFAAP